MVASVVAGNVTWLINGGTRGIEFALSARTSSCDLWPASVSSEGELILLLHQLKAVVVSEAFLATFMEKEKVLPCWRFDLR